MRSLPREGFDRVVEDSLMYVGERKLQLAKRAELEKNIDALDEAGRIERLRLVTHLEECRAATRAASEDLERFDEIDAQRADVHGQILELLNSEVALETEAATCISADAASLGFAFAREELLAPGAVTAMVERRRVRRAGASQQEAEAI